MLGSCRGADGLRVRACSVWGTGQDQMRIVKQRMKEMLPDAQIFLDVDDLKEGRGAEYVDQSAVILIFCSSGMDRRLNW